MSSRRGYDLAKRVLTRCSAVDLVVPEAVTRNDTHLGEIFDRHSGYDFTDAEADQAVDIFYSRGGDVRPKPGDIITVLIAERTDKFMRQSLKDIEAHNDARYVRLAPYIDDVAEAKSVNTALKYQRRECNPLLVPCPYAPCRAIPGPGAANPAAKPCADTTTPASTPPNPEHSPPRSATVTYKYCPSPLIEAYADCELHRQCPNCFAPPDDWCRRPDGTPRPIPCLKRYPARPPRPP